MKISFQSKSRKEMKIHVHLLTRDKSFYRSLILLAIPVALQNLITFLVNFADNLMIGSLGDAVYIFPKRGEKYHSAGCRHLTAASTSGVLTQDMKRKYKSCPLCKSGKAAGGSRVYYFPAAGEDYHLGGCPSLQRNYIEIERQVAMDRGYGACSTCGG